MRPATRHTMTTFNFISNPLWIDKNLDRYGLRILYKEPISHFDQYRYRLETQNPDQIPQLRKRESQAFAFQLEIPMADIEEYQLIKILGALCHQRLGQAFDKHQRIEIGDIIYIYPVDSEGEYFYMDIYQMAVIDVDISKFIGYGLISADIRAWKALETIFFPGVKEIEGVICYKLGDPDFDGRETVFNLYGLLDAYRSQGLIGVAQTLQFSNKLWLATEICRIWNFSIDGKIPLGATKAGFYKANGATGCTFKGWLEQTIIDVVADRIPILIVSGYWRDFEGDILVLRDRLEKQARGAYQRLIGLNPALAPGLKDLEINSDLTIKLPVFDEEDYLNFIDFLMTAPEVEELMQELPAQAPILAGQVVYQEGEFALEFEDGDKRVLALGVVPEGEVEELRQQIQKRWIDGHYITNWGRYLYTKHGRISTWIVLPEVIYDSVEELKIGLGLTPGGKLVVA